MEIKIRKAQTQYTTIHNLARQNEDFYVQFCLERKTPSEDNERLQLGARSRLLLQGLSIKLVQEGPVELDSRRTLQFETGRS
jgi:hypothetical protein